MSGNNGDEVDVLLRIPIPEGFKVKFLKDGKSVVNHVNFLPPVEVNLLPTSKEGLQYEARVSCVWMKFRQVSVPHGP